MPPNSYQDDDCHWYSYGEFKPLFLKLLKPNSNNNINSNTKLDIEVLVHWRSFRRQYYDGSYAGIPDDEMRFCRGVRTNAQGELELRLLFIQA